jgi:hypothetical protein
VSGAAHALARQLHSHRGMDVVGLLERCVALERAAAEIYEALALRFADDAELVALWSALAADEREHARKLDTWRALAAREPAGRRASASGFAATVAELERALGDARRAAPGVRDADQAFALALGLETSELDVIYGELLRSSPVARFPDAADSARWETGRHHDRLLAVVRRRSRDDTVLLRAALLAERPS